MSRPPTNLQKIAVVGATGFTGRLVVAALEARGGLTIRMVGRNRNRLAQMLRDFPGAEGWPIDSWTADGLVEALRSCSAVISCAGPFVRAGRPVAEAAVRVEVPYCDSTGEQSFIRWIYQSLDAPARLAGIPVVPAFGFDYVPGDLGAALVAEGMGQLESIDVFYWSASMATSAGTRRSMVGILREPGYAWSQGRLQREALGRRQRRIRLDGRSLGGISIPGGEALMVPRHVPVRSVSTYLAARVPPVLTRGLPLATLPGVRQAVEWAVTRGPAPDQPSRSRPFGCHVQAVAVDGSRRALVLEGKDVYGFTAEALAELANRMCAGTVDAVGACSPAQAVPAAQFLSRLDVRVREVAAG